MLKKIASKEFWKKKSTLIYIVSILAGALILAGTYCAYGQFYPKELTLGLITDVHAGDQKYRDDGIEPDNNLLPSNYEKNMRSALENLKDADVILTLGDNMNKGGRKHARKMKELTEGYPMIWTKGNHDKRNEYMEIISEETYHYTDKGSWRIIVLDNSEKYPDADDSMEEKGRGYIDKDQMAWLKETLNTRRNVIITMHIPMFRRENLDELRPDYAELENLLVSSGNVKHVFSGHFHIVDWNKELNGIQYHIVPSLSLENHEGQFKKITVSYEK